MNIALIGYRGSGKTTVGRLLAAELRYSFFDADEQIVASAGKSIKDIFQQHGEGHFRELEATVLTRLSTLDNHVISLGGGAVLREENQRAIVGAAAMRIYLRSDPAELLRRIHADPATAATRPNLTNLVGGLDEINSVLTQREPIYRQIMTHEIDVSRLGTTEVAAAIVRLVR